VPVGAVLPTLDLLRHLARYTVLKSILLSLFLPFDPGSPPHFQQMLWARLQSSAPRQA
jgi:hypothetical protein